MAERKRSAGPSISGVTVLRLRMDALEWRAMEGEVLALDSATQRYLATNRTGTVLWAALVEGATREQLVELLRERFDVDEASAARDVDAFVARLRDEGLLA